MKARKVSVRNLHSRNISECAMTYGVSFYERWTKFGR